MMCSKSCSPRRNGGLAISLVLAILAAAPAVAQTPPDDPKELLENYVHYTLIARPELAYGNGQELLRRGLTNAEMAVLIEETIEPQRWDDAHDRALRIDQLESIAGELWTRVEQGRRDLAREAKRIEEAIGMLTGNQRQKMLARGRLLAAGEYAVPALLRVVTSRGSEVAAMACRTMIIEIGREAVMPLCVALRHVDADSQRAICEILGEIGYPQSGPFLLELSQDLAAAGNVREAASRAFARVGAAQTDLSHMFSSLGDQYFAGHESLIAYPYEDTNNVWSYDAFVGLVAAPVPTAIYSEIMAMKMAEHALELSADNREAVGLYVAANLKRENDVPRGGADPVYGDRAYTPAFFATLFGTEVCLDVLGRAIDMRDTPLVRDAIAAMSKTTGGKNLIDAAARGRQPLIEALGYPDRRVQYEAALALGQALPQSGFDGDWRVVPILSTAVRLGSQSFGVVVADDEENRRQEVAALEAAGFTVVGQEATVAAVADEIAGAVAVDVVVVRLGSVDAARTAVGELRAQAKSAAAPIMVIASGVDEPELAHVFRADARTLVSRPFQGEEPRTAALEEVFQRATGGRMTEAEAEAYSFESLGALAKIAISCSPAYDIRDAESALADALQQRSGQARLLVSNILAHIDTDTAQSAIFDAALSAGEGEQETLLAHVADSIKRFSDHSQERHVAALIDLIGKSGGATAEAAARVHGAMNRAKTDAVRLIFENDAATKP
jgi:DNA-binding response OmpR family regulator